MVGFFVLSGIIASIVLLAAEQQSKESFFHVHVNTRLAVGLGAASGAISAIPMTILMLLVYLSHKYTLHLYGGKYFPSSPSIQRERSNSILKGIFALLIIAASFARAVLLILYVVNSLGVPGR
jgi:uncharacterized protein YhhL (DUF1145 family)